MAADVVVLNKRDLAGNSQLREEIGRMVPGALVLEAAHAAVPLEALTGFAAARMLDAERMPSAAPHASHSSQFESVSVAWEGRYSAAHLRTLLARMPAGVLRAKGARGHGRSRCVGPSVLRPARQPAPARDGIGIEPGARRGNWAARKASSAGAPRCPGRCAHACVSLLITQTGSMRRRSPD